VALSHFCCRTTVQSGVRWSDSVKRYFRWK